MSATSTSALISTISEYVEMPENAPPDYNDSLTAAHQSILSMNSKSDHPPTYDYLFNKRSYYTTAFLEIFEKLLTKGFNLFLYFSFLSIF